MLLFLLLTLSAQAQDIRFTPYTAFGVESSLKPYRDAVHKIDSKNGPCAATEISSAGHLLTARHCVQQCLIRSKVFSLRQEKGVDYFVLDRSRLGKATCSIAVDGVAEELVVEATSPGFIAYMDRPGLRSMNSKLYDQMVAEGYTERGDFAVLRRPKPGPACMPLSFSDPKGLVRSLGYPGKTERPGDYNSDGEQLYFTQGEVLSSVKENSCAAELTPAELLKAIEEYDHPGAFMSSLDVIHGSSGASVVDVWGEVVGVLATMYVHKDEDPAKTYCRGSAKALSVNHLRTMLGDLKLECASADPATDPSPSSLPPG